MRKWIYVGIALVVIVLTVFLADGNAPEKTQAEGTIVTFTGVDLGCKGCQAKMKEALSKIIGIEGYQLSPTKNSLTVTFNSDYMKAEWIEKSLQAAGFTIKDMKK
jgi:copper chaperone CopZ